MWYSNGMWVGKIFRISLLEVKIWKWYWKLSKSSQSSHLSPRSHRMEKAYMSVRVCVFIRATDQHNFFWKGYEKLRIVEPISICQNNPPRSNFWIKDRKSIEGFHRFFLPPLKYRSTFIEWIKYIFNSLTSTKNQCIVRTLDALVLMHAFTQSITHSFMMTLTKKEQTAQWN